MSENKELVQIGDLAKQLGITTRTIRYYEEIGLMGLSQRVGTGARLYGRDNIRRLKFILKLKELGISLKEMRELADNFDANNQSFNSQQHQFSAIAQGPRRRRRKIVRSQSEPCADPVIFLGTCPVKPG